MRNNVLLFVALILIGVGAIVYFAISSESTVITVQGKQVQGGNLQSILKYSIGGFLSGLGAIFLVRGLRGRARAAEAHKQKLHILKTGIETEGKVTFVDKNYSFLVNQKPVFSIVEYTYQDRAGQTHSRRINNISSDLVIRKQIQVGHSVAVKYSGTHPWQSILLLQDNAKPPTTVVTCKYCGSKFSISKHESCPKCGAS